MKPRRLHSATILSIVTTSVVSGDCSVIELGCYSRSPDRGPQAGSRTAIQTRVQVRRAPLWRPLELGEYLPFNGTKRPPLTYPTICVYIRCVLLLTRWRRGRFSARKVMTNRKSVSD